MSKSEFSALVSKATTSTSALLTSSLPVLKMFYKLNNRKTSGKSPFPKEYNDKNTADLIDELVVNIENSSSESDFDREKIIASLETLGDHANEAISYIKTASLKTDYQWISETLKNIADCLKCVQ